MIPNNIKLSGPGFAGFLLLFFSFLFPSWLLGLVLAISLEWMLFLWLLDHSL